MAAPKLTPELAAQLERIPTSGNRYFRYAPCRVKLKSGGSQPRVYLAEEGSYLRQWGDDPSRPMLDLADVAAVEESPDRLPVHLAGEVYEAGESGMGYVIFTVRMRDGLAIPFLTGNAVDFLDWPPDMDPRDAVAVEPNVGREHLLLRHGGGRRGANYLWCLYGA